MAKACRILASDVSHSLAREFPLSRSGWTEAREHVYVVRDRYGAGYATLICASGSIPLYQCYKNRSCNIEGSDGSAVLAGARRRRRSRR
jgi:hypothetical protein